MVKHTHTHNINNSNSTHTHTHLQVSEGERELLSIARDRPYLVFSWLNQTIAHHCNSEMGVSAPIVSRVREQARVCACAYVCDSACVRDCSHL